MYRRRLVTNIHLLQYLPEERVYAVSVFTNSNPNSPQIVYLPEFMFLGACMKNGVKEQEGEEESRTCIEQIQNLEGVRCGGNWEERVERDEMMGISTYEPSLKNQSSLRGYLIHSEPILRTQNFGEKTNTNQNQNQNQKTLLDYDYMIEETKFRKVWNQRNKRLLPVRTIRNKSKNKKSKLK